MAPGGGTRGRHFWKRGRHPPRRGWHQGAALTEKGGGTPRRWKVHAIRGRHQEKFGWPLRKLFGRRPADPQTSDQNTS